MKTEEDEAFEFIEQQRRRMELPFRADLNPYETMVRAKTIEEVAKAIEGFKGAFGQATVDSFATFVRGLK